MGMYRTCGTCKYFKRCYTPGPWDDPWTCVNYYSDHYGGLIDDEQTCDEWEKRDNQAD